MKRNNFVYKIQQKSTGLFSAGKSSKPRWAEIGHTWHRLVDVSNHLSGIKTNVYEDAEIVMFNCREIKRVDIKDKDSLKIKNLRKRKLNEFTSQNDE